MDKYDLERKIEDLVELIRIFNELKDKAAKKKIRAEIRYILREISQL